MLHCIEEASLGIAACLLPARDDGAGRLVEPSVYLGGETETGQPALYIATLPLVEADLIFGFLSCFVGQCRWIGGCRQIARGRARAGFGSICADENCQDRQGKDQDTHGAFSSELKVAQ